MLAESNSGIDNRLAAGDIRHIKRLELMRQRRDIDAQLADIAGEPDASAVETGFVKHSAGYGQRKGLQ